MDFMVFMVICFFPRPFAFDSRRATQAGTYETAPVVSWEA